jgi:hypothetical protein
MISDLSARPRTDKAYRLNCNIDHLVKVRIDEDAWLIRNSQRYEDNFNYTHPLDLPERIEFGSIRSMLAQTDYPYTDVGWPIMSKRMIDTLLSVGSFAHRTYPIIMIDQEIDVNSEEVKPALTENHNYFAVQLTEYLDTFDFENSIYERSTINPDVVKNIRWISLREPETGFPPLFTVEPASGNLFVSAEARAALEAANILGIDFQHVEDGVPL